tara:strand:+ start:145 stop:843 length:699 start_codon:yes stop_codon:yes gene_type:complete
MNIEKIKEIIREEMREDSILLDKPELLNEANLKRAQTKIEDEHVPFVMLTAFRGDYSKEENKGRNDEMKMTLKQEGLPWVDMHGSGYKEGGPEGEVVVEDSVLVWDEERGDVLRTSTSLFDTAKALAREFEQDSFLYGGPDLDEPEQFVIRLYTNEGAPIKDAWAGGEEGYSKLNVVEKANSEFWSMIANKATQFKEMRDHWKNFKSKSRLDAMKKQYYLRLAESKIKEIEG